jgi:hypothetical protein
MVELKYKTLLLLIESTESFLSINSHFNQYIPYSGGFLAKSHSLLHFFRLLASRTTSNLDTLFAPRFLAGPDPGISINLRRYPTFSPTSPVYDHHCPKRRQTLSITVTPIVNSSVRPARTHRQLSIRLGYPLNSRQK